MNGVPLVQLIYTSEYASALTLQQARDLAQDSRRSNAAQGITGVLMFGHGRFLQLLEGLGASPDHIDEWPVGCSKLHAIAAGASREIHKRLAERFGFRISADLAGLALAKSERDEARRLNLLALRSLAHLPREWKSKRYRRIEG